MSRCICSRARRRQSRSIRRCISRSGCGCIGWGTSGSLTRRIRRSTSWSIGRGIGGGASWAMGGGISWCVS